jgi:glutamate dehydrogenase
LQRTIAIVDGSGVLFDPDGLDQKEMSVIADWRGNFDYEKLILSVFGCSTRLATARRMIKFFDKSKLGPKGFVVLVEDTDVKLAGASLQHHRCTWCSNLTTNSRWHCCTVRPRLPE